MRYLRLPGLLVACVLGAGNVAAQSVVTFRSPDPAPLSTLPPVGAAVAGLGTDEVLVAGEPGVHVFGVTDGALRRSFGPGPNTPRALAVVGGNIAVGRRNMPGVGSAPLFDGATGALLRTLVAPPGTSGGDLGTAVVAYGSNLLVSEANYGVASVVPDVFLFDPATGAALKNFTNPDADPAAGFGWSVAAVGGTVAVSARFVEKVHLFDATTAAAFATLGPPAGPGSGFGLSVAAVGTSILVGAPLAPPGGEAYLFDGATGTLLRTFLPPAEASEEFGGTVGAFGANALVSADTAGGGAVFVIDPATGAVLRTLHNPNASSGSGFGAAVGTLGDGILVGVPNEVVASDSNVGSAHLFCGGVTGCGPCETCGPLGTCVVGPNPSCQPPLVPQHRRILRIRDFPDDARDVLTWRGKGAFSGTPDFPTQAAEYGDPLTRSDQTLCVFDESVSPAALVFRATAPAGGDCSGDPCWTIRGAVSVQQMYQYSDRERTPDGVQKLQLRHAQPGNGTFSFLGKGVHLSDRPFGLPTLPLPLPSRVQLQAKDGRCWDARYTQARVNTSARFSALSD